MGKSGREFREKSQNKWQRHNQNRNKKRQWVEARTDRNDKRTEAA